MTNISPTYEDFAESFLAQKTQLVSTWISGDLDTPVSAYLKTCQDKPHSFLLESIEGGEKLGRYSIIGTQPDLIWKYGAGQIDIRRHDGPWERANESPLASLRQEIAQCKIDVLHDHDLPPMAVSGLFGFMGYDIVRLVENIADENPDDLKIPDALLTRPTVLIIFDNVKNMICIVTPVYETGDDEAHARNTYQKAAARIENIVNALQAPLNYESPVTKLETPLDVTSNMQPAAYRKIVEQAIEYIKQGENFQTVLSQRFACDFDLPPLELYRALRQLNPSPFMFFLNFDEFALVGSSPEILVRVRDNMVTVRPIAGTRPRGETLQDDQALASDLLADEKECAEHLMLLDLGRNDVGRVAEIGSVRVTEQFNIEYYSHVMHIVSNVEGKLKNDLDIIDALFAGFPAGTVSGAPKVRAMEIIEELEVSRRGYYGGCVGYLSGQGEMDTCIALRTGLVKDGKLYVQAGGGIVADSDPAAEQLESENKAKAVIKAANRAILSASRAP